MTGRKKQVQCAHCGKKAAKRTTRQQKHLDSCTAYQNRPQNGPIPLPSLSQATLLSNMRPLSTSMTASLHWTAAMAVYMSNLPFNHYENPYVQAHEHTLHPNYAPPSHTALSGPLLEEAY